MGPRLISRGVIRRVATQAPQYELQWGRGSLAAACADFVAPAVSPCPLQWGRGSLAAAWASLQTMGNTGFSEALASVPLREGCFVWLGLNGKNIKVDLSKT